MNYSKSDLETMNLVVLRGICQNLGITGMSKKRKEIIIDAILANSAAKKSVTASKSDKTTRVETKPTSKDADTPVKSSSVFKSINADLSKDGGSSARIHVSCGAASQTFEICGKTVAMVSNLLKDILNIPVFSASYVNGRVVLGDYMIKEGDQLEFIKPAGNKGC
jgi:hypothetical protein